MDFDYAASIERKDAQKMFEELIGSVPGYHKAKHQTRLESQLMVAIADVCSEIWETTDTQKGHVLMTMGKMKEIVDYVKDNYKNDKKFIEMVNKFNTAFNGMKEHEVVVSDYDDCTIKL